VIRRRHFEVNWPLLHLANKPPRGLLRHGYLSIAGTGIQKWCKDRGMRFGNSEAREAMGIDWMCRKELSQAIPPAYSEFIGKAALRHLGLSEAA
jgi:DNA (cytosine-5)-methyltransferase 1